MSFRAHHDLFLLLWLFQLSHWIGSLVQTSWVLTLWSPSVMWLYLAWRGEVWRCIWFSTVELLQLPQLCPHLTCVSGCLFSCHHLHTGISFVGVGWGRVNYFIFWGSTGVLFGKKEHASELTIGNIYLDGLLDLKCHRCFLQKWAI